MIGTAGDVLLMLAGALACVQMIAPSLARWRQDVRYLDLIYPSAMIQTLSLTLAMGLLIVGYAVSDFSLLNVVLNSHSEKPLLYKLTGSWGNHEGSMLLWTWLLSVSGLIFGWISRHLREGMLSAHGAIIAGLAAFILFTSNPFVVIDPPAPEGQGMNPLLQDIGLALHPPMLYLGYVGFGVVFAYAIAAMRAGVVNAQWARTIHSAICASWGFLTIGIGLGSWWAYRELGWGGWWFWDPVENVSLLPWLAGTALLHSNITLMKRHQLASGTLLLAILTFALSLIGTFIVRSGILISVHSFATDPARGLFILAFIGMIIGSALWRFAHFRPAAAHRSDPITLISRQGLMMLNALFMLATAATILLAILYPSLLQLLKLPGVTVGAPYFNQTVLPLMVPAVILAGIATLLPWHPTDWQRIGRSLAPAVTISALVFLLVWAVDDHRSLVMAGGLALSAWLISCTIAALWKLYRNGKRIPLSGWSMALGHMGIALFIACITLGSVTSHTVEMVLRQKKPQHSEHITLTWKSETLGVRDNHGFRRAEVDVLEHGKRIATLFPELRHYPERTMQTTEAAIASSLWRDVYLTSALQQDPKKLGFTLHLNPAMLWLWGSFVAVASGGFIAAIRSIKRHDH